MIDNKRLSWVHTRPTSETGFYNKYEAIILTAYDYKVQFTVEEIICEGGRAPRGHYGLFLEQVFQNFKSRRTPESLAHTPAMQRLLQQEKKSIKTLTCSFESSYE